MGCAKTFKTKEDTLFNNKTLCAKNHKNEGKNAHKPGSAGDSASSGQKRGISFLPQFIDGMIGLLPWLAF